MIVRNFLESRNDVHLDESTQARRFKPALALARVLLSAVRKLSMLQLLDLARENAALKRALIESRVEVEALQRLLDAIQEAWTGRTCAGAPAASCDAARLDALIDADALSARKRSE